MKRTTKSLLAGIAGTLVVCCALGGLSIYYVYQILLPEKTVQMAAEIKAQMFEGGEGLMLTENVERGEPVESAILQRIPIPEHISGEYIVTGEPPADSVVAARALKKGMLLYRDMIYSPVEISRDLRIYEIKEAVMPLGIKCGESVDVRISFPSGLDYVVLSKKEVKGLVRDQSEGVAADASLSGMSTSSQQGVPIGSPERNEIDYLAKAPAKMMVLHLNAQEILRYSSAMVDAFFTPGTYLYVTQYVSPEFQEEAVVNYPCNEAVQRLLLEDPNVVNLAKDGLVARQRELLNTSLTRIDKNQVRPNPQEAISSPVISVEKKAPSLSDLDN